MVFNLFGSVRNLYGKAVRGFKTIGSGLRNASGKIGTLKNILSAGYHIGRHLPYISQLLGGETGERIGHGIEAIGAGGNLLGELGRGNISSAVNEGVRGVNEAMGGGNALRDYIWARGRAPAGDIAGHYEPGVGGGLPRLVRGPGPVQLQGDRLI
jgi:hypothetical protein